MRKILHKTLYRYTLVISIILFCALIFLQVRDSKLGIPQLNNENQLLNTIYQGLISFPILSSLLLALLGFFIVSNLIISLYDNQKISTGVDFQTEIKPLDSPLVQLNTGVQASLCKPNLPLNTSLSIFDAVIKCELNRLEDEVERLRNNAFSIAQTNQVIENLMTRISTIIIDTQTNIDHFHVNIPAANSLLKELDSLSIQAERLTKSIASSIDKLLIETDLRTANVSNIIKHVLHDPKEEQTGQINTCLAEFDVASKLSNELALEQADIAQDVKMQLNQLSEIAKETNLKSQCIVNSMRDISNTKQDQQIKTIKVKGH